jgi:FKBP-type peptidyl-prolyl cis-trans isomerase 2
MAEERPSRWLPTLLIVLVLVVAGVGAALLYEYTHPQTTAAVQTVQIGSNVTVNYIGMFGSGPQTGRVFDTSLVSVALNNVSYPKSLEFSLRSPLSEYSPLPVAVGPNAASYSIGNLTFGSVVTGFWQGLIGLPVGKSAEISVPPNLGYGALVPACLVTAPLTTTVPIVATVPAANFSTQYPNVTATAGTEFSAAPYNWTAVVLNANASAVTVENLPSVGEPVTSDGLPALVTAISKTSITVAIQVGLANVGLLVGHVKTAVCGSTTFILQSMNSAGGTYVQNFNHEVVGQTLVFTVTVVKFY